MPRGRIAIHRAYPIERPGAIPASFPNDQLFRYISVDPYISGPDLRRAVAKTTDHNHVVEIRISPIARKKLNAVASWNLRASKQHDFNARVALGVVVDGTPAMVIQGTRRLDANVLWVLLGSDAQALSQAHLFTALVNEDVP